MCLNMKKLLLLSGNGSSTQVLKWIFCPCKPGFLRVKPKESSPSNRYTTANAGSLSAAPEHTCTHPLIEHQTIHSTRTCAIVRPCGGDYTSASGPKRGDQRTQITFSAQRGGGGGASGN